MQNTTSNDATDIFDHKFHTYFTKVITELKSANTALNHSTNAVKKAAATSTNSTEVLASILEVLTSTNEALKSTSEALTCLTETLPHSIQNSSSKVSALSSTTDALSRVTNALATITSTIPHVTQALINTSGSLTNSTALFLTTTTHAIPNVLEHTTTSPQNTTNAIPDVIEHTTTKVVTKEVCKDPNNIDYIKSVINKVIDRFYVVLKEERYHCIENSMIKLISQFSLIMSMILHSAPSKSDEPGEKNHANKSLADMLKSYYIIRTGNVAHNIGTYTNYGEYINNDNYSLNVMFIQEQIPHEKNIYELVGKMNILLRHMMVVLKHPLVNFATTCIF